MYKLEKFEDVVLLIKNKGNVSFDLEGLNSDDYSKAINFILRFKGTFKKVTRFKFIFNYD